MNLLVVAAWEPELERFRSLAAPSFAQTVRVVPVGIGLVDASLGMTRCIIQANPTHVIALGTCGKLPRASLNIHDVIVGISVRLVDPVVVEGRAAMPYAEGVMNLDGQLLDVLENAGARAARVVNTLGITTDNALATKLSALGDVEHLEAYAIARACHAAGVPCAVVLGVANVVGSTGREEWKANHVEASARAATVVHEALVRSSTTPR